ncbi:MAG: 3'(2'),5'-bisphosphate nucleotidase [Phycisphaerales bacterium]|nr:3'(2'),5'-bisphosphate nucleotidase [Phycisphaerales bacterium]
MAHALTTFLQPALEAVATAAEITRSVQANLASIGEHAKDDRSPVTVADYAAQAIVSLVLESAGLPPGDRLIVGEEDSEALQGPELEAVRAAVVATVSQWRPGLDEASILAAIDCCDHDGSAAGYWTLDPVDGTKGFLRGQQYAIALGRIEQGEVVLGVLGCPNLPIDVQIEPTEADPTGIGSLYAAVRGEGSWEYPGADPYEQPLRIHCPTWSSDMPVRTCASVEKAHTNRSDTDRLLDHIGANIEPVRLDSQAKYAVLARGQADAYLRMPTRPDYVERIWDHAAGSLLASEAGAIVTDITGAPLDFTCGAGLERNRGVVAAAAGLHPQLIDGIRTLDLIPTVS